MNIIPEKWINEPDENGTGFLQAWAESGEESFPIPIETHNVSMEDVTLNVEQNFEFLMEGASDIQVYTDEKDYYQKHKGSFAAEAFCPAGLFSPNNDENFVQTPKAIIHGQIVETYEDATEFGFGPDDVIFSMNCLGYELNCVIHNCPSNISRLEVGNYISGIFWVQGWPEEE